MSPVVAEATNRRIGLWLATVWNIDPKNASYGNYLIGLAVFL